MIMRRRKEKTNREVIESENPKVEHAYVKFPRKRLIPVTKKSDEHSVDTDLFKLHTLMKSGGHKDYIGVHNHPHIPTQTISGFPSASDLKHFFLNRKMNGTVIAQRDNHTGKLMGYTLLLKGKNFKKAKLLSDEELNSYSGNLTRNNLTYNIKNSYDEIRQLARDKRFGLKFIPARGFYFNKSTGSYEKTERGLEKKAMIILGIAGFIFSIFFLSFNFTGNVVSNEMKHDGNILGIISFLVGIIGLFLHFRRRDKQEDNK